MPMVLRHTYAAARRSCSAGVCPRVLFGSRSSLCSLLAVIVLISSALFAAFVAIVWLTVASDAQLVDERTLANATGVSSHRFAICRSLYWYLC